jgi:hypothetical protein
MKTHPLKFYGFLDPAWLRSVQGHKHAATVSEHHTVTVQGVMMHLLGDNAPAVSTAVQVWLNGSGFFVCATLDEIEREAQARRDAEAAEAEQRRQKLDARRADAEAFNARIALPVKWDVGIKDVLSGLSENSWGDGRSKATVEHIYLLEPLEAGRLTRKEGDFLCTSASSTNGKRWAGQIAERCHDGEGNPYQPKVSCKACITLAQRWMKESS